MSLLDWLVVLAYLGLSLALGLWVARRGAKNMAEFFVGGTGDSVVAGGDLDGGHDVQRGYPALRGGPGAR